MKMKIRFFSSSYMMAHGRKPKGYGAWAFEVDLLDGATPLVWRLKASTLTNAKKEMTRILRATLPKDQHLVYVTICS